MKYLLNQSTEMGSFQQMHETKKGGKKQTNRRNKRNQIIGGKKKSRLLPVSLFTGAPHKYATSLSGNQCEEEAVFKRKIVLPAHI